MNEEIPAGATKKRKAAKSTVGRKGAAKKSGSGKPPITMAEKAAALGLSLSEYKERASINIHKRKLVNDYISTHAKGVSSQAKRSQIFKDAWKHAASEIRSKPKTPADRAQLDSKLKKLGIK